MTRSLKLNSCLSLFIFLVFGGLIQNCKPKGVSKRDFIQASNEAKIEDCEKGSGDGCDGGSSVSSDANAGDTSEAFGYAEEDEQDEDLDPRDDLKLKVKVSKLPDNTQLEVSLSDPNLKLSFDQLESQSFEHEFATEDEYSIAIFAEQDGKILECSPAKESGEFKTQDIEIEILCGSSDDDGVNQNSIETINIDVSGPDEILVTNIDDLEHDLSEQVKINNSEGSSEINFGQKDDFITLAEVGMADLDNYEHEEATCYIGHQKLVAKLTKTSDADVYCKGAYLRSKSKQVRVSHNYEAKSGASGSDSSSHGIGGSFDKNRRLCGLTSVTMGDLHKRSAECRVADNNMNVIANSDKNAWAYCRGGCAEFPKLTGLKLEGTRDVKTQVNYDEFQDQGIKEGKHEITLGDDDKRFCTLTRVKMYGVTRLSNICELYKKDAKWQLKATISKTSSDADTSIECSARCMKWD